MNALVQVPHDEQEEAHISKGKWEMKELKPWHKQMCSMLAQGIPRQTIASVLDCTPEYVSMLAGQRLIKEYIASMCQYAGLQLEAQFVQTAEAIGDVLANGNNKERMQAARLQLEVTKRIGSGSGLQAEVVDTNARLAKLAERLLYLQGGNKDEQIIEGEFHENAQQGSRLGSDQEDGN